MTKPGPILLVDDDRGMQITIAAILEDAGYEVLIADDGLDGLAKLERAHPSAILLDIGMPRMDGFAFSDELDRRGLRPGIPVLVLTADGRAEEKARRVNAEAYLHKPFLITELIECVRGLVGRDAAPD